MAVIAWMRLSHSGDIGPGDGGSPVALIASMLMAGGITLDCAFEDVLEETFDEPLAEAGAAADAAAGGAAGRSAHPAPA